MLALLFALIAPDWSLPAARPCAAAELAELTTPSTEPYRLLCRAVLEPGQTVRRRILIEGAEASGAGLDCRGGAVTVAGPVPTTRTPTIAIWSRRVTAEHWSRPTDVVLRDCRITGSIRVWGMGADGSYDDLRASSRTTDHVARTQAAAPSHVTLEGLELTGVGSIPLYAGPGVTRLSLTGSRLTGRSDATAIYLDAESADNRIVDNAFAVRTRREQIAVDGSARNTVTGNRFVLNGQGGVFLYRNCGERGVIRHQTPSDNQITDNVFTGAARWRPQTVVVGSREGRRAYCGQDKGWPFGSSADDGDGATGNVVAPNEMGR
ncbi:MAG: right-handed parallel beta-helix repeat-containing protein [Brevundimonas sp.]|uniref:right-handed parallel beta-helix repeat-containing protein n=1 Tax=Brevundimonas sp. TaxID=1871086 RepID=UPI001215FAD3|nr:right-handed parallel beta-helix repeat-containing protein [Brevundimonas sp.]RZJ18904.1 MAG: right-handed parallel beta-helix repeat-containing protein [Brevundimonas sp.]